MKKLLCAALLALCCSAAQAAGIDFDPETVSGPSVEKICMVIVANADSQVLAAEKGEIDVLSDIARPSDINRLSASPRLDMSLARGFHAFFLLMNNQTPPWNDPAVRRAAAMSTDRNSMVRNIYQGYCEPINSWLPPVSPWASAEGTRNIFDRAAARELLLSAGYRFSYAGRLLMPDGSPVPAVKLLAPLARVAPTTAEMAEQIAASLNASGFDVEVEPMDFSAMIARLDRKDYSLAVLAWSMGRNPDSLYSFYHSSMDVPGGYNMTGIHDASLDAALERLRYAPDKESAEKASAEAQRLLAELVPSVPIYSRFSVAAFSNQWKNVISTEKITADNMWTLMRAVPREGPMRPLTMALAEEPRSLNPFTASSAYSWQVLGQVYEGLIGTSPLTLEDMPGLAESWKVAVEGAGKDAHTALTFRLRPGLKWNDGSPLTANDLKATIDFLKKNQIPRFYDAVKNVASAEALDERELKVTMTGVSYWYLDNIAGLPYMPERVLKGVSDWQNWDPLGSGGPSALVGAGPFALEEYRPGEYVMMTRNPHYWRLSLKEAKAR
ncbi:MAG: ABC transporter substrate-binding protein [Pyramidobacter sp.]|nr:ABC transporter substrate-binding protein [Pyramidobacter sp.]